MANGLFNEWIDDLGERKDAFKMNLYDQLVQLQVPEAYISWKAYREQLTQYIVSEMSSKDRVAILGVGRGNDIDLGKLMLHTGTLTLWDKDAKALDEAINQYGLKGQENLHLVDRDLIGLSVEDYRHYADQLVRTIRQRGMETAISDLVEVALKQLEELTSKMQVTNLGEKAYDIVIVIGLHSQLLSMLEWIWQVILQTLGKEEQYVRETIMALNTQIIKAFHEQLLKATTTKLIIGCELGRIGRAGSIQGAVQGLQDLERLRQQGRLQKQSECVLEWPFHLKEGVIYNMLIQCDQIL